MSHYLRRIAAMLACLVASAVQAAPDQVFRVDDRNPSVIFQAGFRTWGSNSNLLEHIEGSTCNVPGTARAAEGSNYISTSQTAEAARNVARVRLRQMVDAHLAPVVWMYTIRATPAVYNVARTFEASGQTLGTGRLQPAYRAAVALNEWVVRGPITRDLIVGAQQYELVNGVVVPVRDMYLANPNYVPAATEANPGPLTPSVLTEAQTTMGRLRAALTDGARLAISACYCNSNTHGATERSTRAVPEPGLPGSACTAAIRNVWPATPSATYVPGPGFWRADL
jgi:pertussis toxin subunit 1